MDDRNSRLPVPAATRLPVKRSAPPTALWRQAAPVVARGAALVAAGLIGEWLLRTAARNAFVTPRAIRKKPRSSTATVTRHADQSPEGTIVLSETIFMRRVIVRR